MKMKKSAFFALTLVFMPSLTAFPDENAVDVKGEYLGQEPPGMTPELFAPGIVSTDNTELNSVFTPDGKEFYFSIRKDDKYTIMFMQQDDGRWSEPKVTTFSTDYSNVDMCVSYDGEMMFYGSNRPLSGQGPAEPGFDIWMVRRTETGWSEPENLGPEVNSGEHQIYPTVTKDGTLYFQSRRDGNVGGSDVYRARLADGKYLKPENVGNAINTEANEGDVLIAPDESFLIVSSRGRSDSLGGSDLYISFRRPDGSWTNAKNMGKVINSDATEYCPMLSPDGRYLFFTSTRTGNGDIYWVDAKIIDTLKN
jgi:Tol biopolymer transport system component